MNLFFTSVQIAHFYVTDWTAMVPIYSFALFILHQEAFGYEGVWDCGYEGPRCASVFWVVWGWMCQIHLGQYPVDKYLQFRGHNFLKRFIYFQNTLVGSGVQNRFRKHELTQNFSWFYLAIKLHFPTFWWFLHNLNGYFSPLC